MEKIQYACYDFFLIVTRTRFTENDQWLSQAVKKNKKSFFFVRTHVDQDLVNEARDHPETYEEGKVLDKIRKDSMKNMSKIDADAKVFVISGLLSQTSQYDFGLMADTLLKEYPLYKRQAMILSMTMNCVGREKQK